MKIQGTFKTSHARQLAKQLEYTYYITVKSNSFKILEKAEQFFSQPLTPEMFGCNLEEPKKYQKNYPIGHSKQDIEAYQQARQKLVFENWKIVKDCEAYKKYSIGNLSIIFYTGIDGAELDGISDVHITTLSDILHEVEKYNREFDEICNCVKIGQRKIGEISACSERNRCTNESKIITLTLTESTINQLTGKSE